MKPPPKHPPKRLQTTGDLRRLQRMMATALLRPLTADDKLQPRWIDGRPMEQVAAEFIKPNDRLTSFERLQLYNRMYWFRLFDAIRDDCPGLLHLLGEERFNRLSQAYLERYPSRSFTLRDLCSRLEKFIGEMPALTAPHTRLALEIARFEWAQTVAFDGESRPVVDPASLAAVDPGKLRLGLQPYVSLLALEYPIDDYVISVKRRDSLRAEASNTPEKRTAARSSRRRALPRRRRVYVAVHRHNNRMFYKRLEPAAYRVLVSLAAGAPLSRALAAAGPRVGAARVQQWFTAWMSLGWLCNPGPAKRSGRSPAKNRRTLE